VNGSANGLGVLGAMVTPAVLILACGTLITSTASRLARIVDRVRTLSQALEKLWTNGTVDFADARNAELERQLAIHAERGRLIQRSLTSFYVALGVFVATSISLAVVVFLPAVSWIPTTLGMVGSLVLFHGCVLLIRETRLAMSAVRSEMDFVLGLRDRYASKRTTR
jgi:uncharacterized protein DUF2721